ncbi:FkbM family methyltransferase [Hydrogenophaga sp.]|uniref:FkbM family methyltransferase n=1 Tax=Hydrogenophaga sp. TaxID=1904254 RepID=UPI002731E009|nr:FkbM family methyltransferase [Hydrogenophaga sp.]MDP1683936.1 FkbM family methyltransferase [Hydrogenophaga sp.]
MLNIKLTTCAPNWPWARQTPSGSFVWEDIVFHVDREVECCDAWVVFESLSGTQTSTCPPDCTVFVTGEPSTIGSYIDPFLGQFARVVSGRNDIRHAGLIRRQQGHPWFVEKSYDELVNMSPVSKQADVCLITSDKVFTQGHRDRLQFALELKACLGSRLDIWGRGLRDFNSSWDVLSRYRYAIVLENLVAPDWLTEKLPDALLAWCVPVYLGCTNVADYLPAGSWIDLDNLDAEAAAHKLSALLNDPSDYERRLLSLQQARLQYLNKLQFFANIAPIVRELCASSGVAARPTTLYPQHLVPVPQSAPSPQETSGIPRKLAGALRIPAWRMLEWADELSPIPVPPSSPPSPPEQPPPPVSSVKQVSHGSWVRALGDQTLRMDYEISAEEIVLDVGGFEGQWASDIFSRYLCSIHVFEPVPRFANAIRQRFSRNPSIQLHEAALGSNDATLSITIDGDASSTLLEGEQHIDVPILRCADVIARHAWSEIALMKINIEGGEYELLEHLLDTGFVSRVRNFQVQFHDFVLDAHPRMLAIQERLRVTHELTYYFPFIWENWKRKDTKP